MNYRSRLLHSIDTAISTSTDKDERVYLHCRRAIHYARLNSIDMAQGSVAYARREAVNGLSAVSGAWIMLSEGIIALFSHDLPTAHDRVRRAFGISLSAGLSREISSTSAWLAHIHLHQADYEHAIEMIGKCLAHAAADDHFSRFRIALVASDLYGHAGDIERARKWSKVAHMHATKEGDETAIAALLFNTAMQQINIAMITDAFDEPIPEYFAQARKELDSSIAFDSAFGNMGMPELPVRMKGHAQVILKNFLDARTLLEDSLAGNIYWWEKTAAYADLAVCCHATFDPDAARKFASLAVDHFSEPLDPDTELFCRGRLIQYFMNAGDATQARRHQNEVERCREGYLKVQSFISAGMGNLSLG